jgi:two-component system cell cycle response regulator DivK
MGETEGMQKILVVEDNETNLYLIKFILEKNGFEVIEAKSGVEAVALAVQENPDLIIMDIQLPDIDGLEATKRIRVSEADGDIPIVALTAYATADDVQNSMAAGCTGYIEKPIDPESFMSELQKYLLHGHNSSAGNGSKDRNRKRK